MIYKKKLIEVALPLDAINKPRRVKSPFATGTRAPAPPGFSWGRIIHKLLEAVARDEGIDLSTLTDNLRKEEGRLPLTRNPSCQQ